MGGTDAIHQQIPSYTIAIERKSCILQFYVTAFKSLFNSWFLYRNLDNDIAFLPFMRDVTEKLLYFAEKTQIGIPKTSVAQFSAIHVPARTEKRGTCSCCRQRTQLICWGCEEWGSSWQRLHFFVSLVMRKTTRDKIGKQCFLWLTPWLSMYH